MASVGAAERVARAGAELQSLGLDANKVHDEGALCVAQALPHCSSLTHLGLGGNAIGPAGAVGLVRALGEGEGGRGGAGQRHHVDLRWNQIGALGSAALAAAAGEQRMLTHVEWSRAGHAEATASGRQRGGWHLDLSGNVVGDDGARRVAMVLGDSALLPNIILH